MCVTQPGLAHYEVNIIYSSDITWLSIANKQACSYLVIENCFMDHSSIIVKLDS